MCYVINNAKQGYITPYCSRNRCSKILSRRVAPVFFYDVQNCAKFHVKFILEPSQFYTHMHGTCVCSHEHTAAIAICKDVLNNNTRIIVNNVICYVSVICYL
jgi:hypothetical protein